MEDLGKRGSEPKGETALEEYHEFRQARLERRIEY